MAGALSVAVLIEMLLFRTFSRTGIYLLNEDTPVWVFRVYRSAVWLGDSMYNFAAILVVMLMLAGAMFMFSQRRAFSSALPLLVVVLVAWSVGLIFVSTGPAMSVAYLGLSVATMIAAIAATWRLTRWPARVASVTLGASFLCVYYFETIAPLRLSGFTFPDHGIGIFQLGEALMGVGIIAAFWAFGRTRRIRIMLLPLSITILIIVGYVGGPDRYPLISTWSMGVIMNMPFYVYAGGFFLLSVTLSKLLTSGQRTTAFALVLLFLTHRMLPLTYFNLLLIAGFMLLSLGAFESARPVKTPGNHTTVKVITDN